MFLFVYLERQWSAPKDWSLAFLLSNAPRQCLTITLPSLSGKSHRISRVHYLEQEVKMHTTRLKTSSFQGPTLLVHYIPVVTLNGYTISTGFILSRPDWYSQMTHWFEVSFYRLVLGLIPEYYPQTNLLTLENVFVFLLVICDLTSSPSKLVFAFIFLFLGFYHPYCAHISNKEDPHTFLALTKSWKRGKFWYSSLHPTHNACSDFLWIKSGSNFWIF